MLELKVLYVEDGDFSGDGRTIVDLNAEASEATWSADLVLCGNTVLKNRMGISGTIVGTTSQEGTAPAQAA